MTTSFGFNEFFQLIQALGIIAALIYTAKQYKALKKEIHSRAFNETVDRMHGIRELIISDKDLPKLFENGKEGDALKEIECYKHFYLMNMIFHMNESLYLALQAESPGDVSNNSRYAAWRNNLMVDLTATIPRKIWANKIVQDSYEKSFQNEVNAIIHDIEQPRNCDPTGESKA